MSDTGGFTPMEPLPGYVEDQVPQSPFDALVTRIAGPLMATDPDARVILESFIESQKAPAYTAPEHEPPEPIGQYPRDRDHLILTRVKQNVVKELFTAIKTEDNQSIALLIQHNLVTANTTGEWDGTPLLEAIKTKCVPVVQQLLELGADPNMFGIASYSTKLMRTPLMLAASEGSLPIVKLLFEPPYSANDALVAPDGQIALRLAITAGHRPVSDYLPSRRAGGFLRFRTHHVKNIERMKTALRKIYHFFRFFIWDVPRFFVWSVPKHVVVLPIVRSVKWCWANRKGFQAWCGKIPGRVAGLGKAVWGGVKKIPKVVKDMGKALWKFGTETLPRWVKKFAIWLWTLVTKRIPNAIFTALKALWKFGTETLPRWVKTLSIWFWTLVTKRIPNAILIALKWTWSLIKSAGQAIWDVILKIASLLHTVLQAIIMWFRNVTLKDIWNSFCDVLRAVFVTFPTTLWSWARSLVTVSYKIMETLFGWVGEVVWWIGYGLVWIALYVPKKLWVILQSLGGSFAKALQEIMVWINPKA